MSPAILSCVKCQFGKFFIIKQGNVEKTDVGGEIQDICQELPVTSGHTKSFFSKIFGRFLKHGNNKRRMVFATYQTMSV